MLLGWISDLHLVPKCRLCDTFNFFPLYTCILFCGSLSTQSICYSSVCGQVSLWAAYAAFFNRLLQQIGTFSATDLHIYFFWQLHWRYIKCLKCIKDQQINLNFIDVLLLYYGRQHVSATHVATFKVISLRTRIHLWLKCVWITLQY